MRRSVTKYFSTNELTINNVIDYIVKGYAPTADAVNEILDMMDDQGMFDNIPECQEGIINISADKNGVKAVSILCLQYPTRENIYKLYKFKCQVEKKNMKTALKVGAIIVGVVVIAGIIYFVVKKMGSSGTDIVDDIDGDIFDDSNLDLGGDSDSSGPVTIDF